MYTPKQMAELLNISPKRVRRVLRNSGEFTYHEHGARWVFTVPQAVEVTNDLFLQAA